MFFFFFCIFLILLKLFLLHSYFLMTLINSSSCSLSLVVASALPSSCSGVLSSGRVDVILNLLVYLKMGAITSCCSLTVVDSFVLAGVVAPTFSSSLPSVASSRRIENYRIFYIHCQYLIKAIQYWLIDWFYFYTRKIL